VSDGWGDASGIEGNYEDENPEETDASTEAGGDDEPASSSGTTNIKEEWNGRTIYVPDGVLADMEDAYLQSQLELRGAGRTEFKKSRHFYPLVVQFGLEALGEADAEEIQTRLADLEGE
jgi:hypothetical protein